jgi:hypothetical protein
MASSLAKKSASRANGPKIAEALKRIEALPASGQDAIAGLILETLDDQPSQPLLRFRALIEQKYIAGLSPAETEELSALEANFAREEAPFYEAILKRAAAPPRPRARRKTQ